MKGVPRDLDGGTEVLVGGAVRREGPSCKLPLLTIIPKQIQSQEMSWKS
jgi:hypothetical protein